MKRIAFLAVAAAAVGLSNTASADLVVNGSFEAPAIANGTYSYLASIPGWTLDTGPAIEIQNHVAGSPFDGNQFVELDSSANSSMYQNLATVAGQTYELSFAYSPRPGVAANSTGIAVYWNGVDVVNMKQSGIGLSDTRWMEVDLELTATSSVTRLEFAATGISDSYGGYLDKVSVQAVPEPASLALCGIGGVIGVVARRRRKIAA